MQLHMHLIQVLIFKNSLKTILIIYLLKKIKIYLKNYNQMVFFNNLFCFV